MIIASIIVVIDSGKIPIQMIVILFTYYSYLTITGYNDKTYLAIIVYKFNLFMFKHYI